MPERHNIFDNPFRPVAQQSAPDNRISNLEKRAEKAETALLAARRDLAAERERNGLAAEVDVEAARRKERKKSTPLCRRRSRHSCRTSPSLSLSRPARRPPRP